MMHEVIFLILSVACAIVVFLVPSHSSETIVVYLLGLASNWGCFVLRFRRYLFITEIPPKNSNGTMKHFGLTHACQLAFFVLMFLPFQGSPVRGGDSWRFLAYALLGAGFVFLTGRTMIDCVSSRLPLESRMCWLKACLLLPFLGCVGWFLLGRNKSK